MITSNKNIKKIFKWILILFISLIILEILSKIITFVGYGYVKKPSEIIRDDNLNSYVELIEKTSKCTYFNTLFPHPYLGWIQWNNPKCSSLKDVNSDGFLGSEFPIFNDEKYYDILITGGSVASQFSIGGNCNDKNNNFCRDYLGEALKNYRSENGNLIRVFNGAHGAYKHPHQSIVSILFGKNFDLIISIEGFNEHYMLRDKIPKKFSFPASNFDIATNSFFIENSINKILVDITLFYKNLGEKFYLLENSHFHALSYRILKKITMSFATNNQRKENFNNLWNYNKKDLEKLDLENFQYENLKSMWRSFINASNANGADAIVVIHPVPQLYKNLSEVEKDIVKHDNYKEVYLNMAKEAKNLRNKEGLKIYDLLKIFENESDIIYTDHSHMNAKGNTIMGENIKEILIANQLIFEKK